MLGLVVDVVVYGIALAIIAGGLFLLWHATAIALEEWRRGEL